MKTNIKVAALQATPPFLNLQESLKMAVSHIDEAARNHARLIAFPESFLPGFPWWLDLGDPTCYGMPFYKKLYENALEIPSKELAVIGEAARRNQIFVCMSATVRDGGSLYLAQLWFDSEGNLIGQHRKIKPTNAERTVWGEGDGSTMKVLDTSLGRLGGLLCWENLMPATQLVMAAQNEQIHVASWPAGSTREEHLYHRNTFIRTNQQYAAVTGTFVIAASQPYDEKTREMLCGKDKYKHDFIPLGGGFSAIYDPMGRQISEMLPEDAQGIVYAQINLEEIIESKYYFDPAGHYSKGSVIQVQFHTENQSGVLIDDKGVTEKLLFGELRKGSQDSLL